ncbi:MAG TPA: amidohydrolase family protein [Chloroflexota bacterium]|nr:amidohydrolase family protein [Chloroflexota bacterium]
MTASHETPVDRPGGAARARGSVSAAGSVPGRPYIDVHAHLGETINRVPPVGQSAEKYLARMAQSGVVAAIPCPAAGGPQARGVLDTRDEAEAIAGACRRYPRRFPLGLANLEVRHQRAGVDELERGMAESGLLGFMVHPGISGHQLGPVLHEALEVVAARGGLALLHVGGGASEAAAGALARRFPGATFIMAHVSTTATGHRAAIEHLAGLENVWADFAQHPSTADASWDIPHLVRHFGEGRLLFGSDAPYFDYRRLQAQIEGAGLPERLKDAIAHGNATGLIRRFRPRWEPDLGPVGDPQGPLLGPFAEVDLWRTQPGQPARLV